MPDLRIATPADRQVARLSAQRLTEQLLKAGIEPREVAAVADIQGHRRYRHRRYAEALIWFERAVQIDRSFEPALYNAARAALQLRDYPAAARYLKLLQRRGTPLARRRLQQLREAFDFARLWQAGLPAKDAG